MIYIAIKRLFRRLKKQREFNARRRQSDYRATSLAVQLALSGSLQSCRRGVSVVSKRERKLLVAGLFLLGGCATVPQLPQRSPGVVFEPCLMTVSACDTSKERCTKIQIHALCQQEGPQPRKDR